jgi:hypothetical protein
LDDGQSAVFSTKEGNDKSEAMPNDKQPTIRSYLDAVKFKEQVRSFPTSAPKNNTSSDKVSTMFVMRLNRKQGARRAAW